MIGHDVRSNKKAQLNDLKLLALSFNNDSANCLCCYSLLNASLLRSPWLSLEKFCWLRFEKRWLSFEKLSLPTFDNFLVPLICTQRGETIVN